MSKINDKRYTKAIKGLTKREIAESIIKSQAKFSSKKEHDDFLNKRLALLNNRTKDELIVSNLLQLKFEIATYLELGKYDSRYSFASCLKRYMQIVNRTSKDLTEELTIHKTKLSRILNEREEGNSKLSYKLEKHSGLLLPAILWWKLITLKKESEILTNKKERKEASRNIKSVVKLRGVYG